MHALALTLLLAAPQDAPKAKSPLDEKIAAALKNHPDIKAAEAKRALAEAELEQAKLAITQRVSAAVSKVELAKAKLMQTEEEVAVLEQVLKMGNVMSQLEKAQHMKARPALIGAKAELAAAELELQQLIGPAVKADAKSQNRDPLLDAKLDLPAAKLPNGPVAEQLEAAVLRTYKLDFKEMDVKRAFEGLLAVAKLDAVPVRGMKTLGGEFLKAPPKFESLTGQNSFEGWVQLFVDELNGSQKGLPDDMKGKYEVYVREYGLLVERVDTAPKDAITLAEFARAVRAKKGAK